MKRSKFLCAILGTILFLSGMVIRSSNNDLERKLSTNLITRECIFSDMSSHDRSLSERLSPLSPNYSSLNHIASSVSLVGESLEDDLYIMTQDEKQRADQYLFAANALRLIGFAVLDKKFAPAANAGLGKLEAEAFLGAADELNNELENDSFSSAMISRVRTHDFAVEKVVPVQEIIDVPRYIISWSRNGKELSKLYFTQLSERFVGVNESVDAGLFLDGAQTLLQHAKNAELEKLRLSKNVQKGVDRHLFAVDRKITYKELLDAFKKSSSFMLLFKKLKDF